MKRFALYALSVAVFVGALGIYIGVAAETVAPGLVRWHADFDSAVAAARTSGKPVLHFQLLGNLDDALC